MANIVGEDHLAYVKDQIKTRQDILGKPSKTSSDIVWENASTSWVRLLSSVNIEDQIVLKFDETIYQDVTGSDNGASFRNEFLGLENYKGNQLSQELVLQGGTLNNTKSKFGVTNDTSNLPNSNYNYGFGGTDFGIKPMPGITSFNSKTYSNGSLRKATISLIAHNRKQFEYIESTYIRLGYTMLVEWGNSNYPLSVDEYASTQDISELTLQNEFLTGFDKGTDLFYTKIENLRKKSKGNYDAFLGRVTNFSWEFTKEGSYIISLDLMSIGSVIESLKINTSLDNIKYTLPSGSTPEESSNDPTPEEDRPTALEVAIDLLTTTQVEEVPVTVKSTFSNTRLGSTNQFVNKTITSPIKTSLTEEEAKSLNLETTAFTKPNNILSCNAAYGNETQESKHYLRLGVLLEFINRKLLVYDKNQNPALISIDNSEDTYCYSNGYSFSGDPSKMINKLDVNLGDEEIKVFPSLPEFHTKIGTERVGKVMNLFYEKEYLKGLIKSKSDEEGNLSIYEFLNQILIDTNRFLGGVNKLKLRVVEKTFAGSNSESTQTFEAVGEAQFVAFNPDATGEFADSDDIAISDSLFQTATITASRPTEPITKQVLEIYDEVPFKKIDTNPVFNIYGFNGNAGNFVRDYQLTTTLDKDFATMISIGAQATGRAVGEDATVFSKWNIGLVDRIIPTKLDIEKAGQENAQSRVDFAKLRETYKNYLRKLKSSSELSFTNNPGVAGQVNTFAGYGFPDLYLSTTGNNNPTFTKFLSIQREFFNKILSYDAERKGITTPFVGFLPINLSLTFDGLSGIRIFDQLTIDSRYLPKNYGETLTFIITELDHVIENNKWITKIGTQSRAKLFDERPEVAIEEQITRVIEESIIELDPVVEEETPEVIDNRIDSYFYIDRAIARDFRIGRRPKGRRTNSVDEVLQYINNSPYVQNKFRKFLNGLLERYPKDFRFNINSITRKLDTTTGVGIGSTHVWGFAIDMSIYKAFPEGDDVDGDLVPSKDKLYVKYGTPAGALKWSKLGVPDIAKAAGLRWGGTWTAGTWVYDCVHFDAIPDWTSVSENAKEVLFEKYPKIQTLLLNRTKRSKEILGAINQTNFLRISNENGKTVFSAGELEFVNFYGLPSSSPQYVDINDVKGT